MPLYSYLAKKVLLVFDPLESSHRGALRTEFLKHAASLQVQAHLKFLGPFLRQLSGATIWTPLQPLPRAVKITYALSGSQNSYSQRSIYTVLTVTVTKTFLLLSILVNI